MKDADLIFYNGRIITCSTPECTPAAEAIAVCGDKILAIGSSQEILKFGNSNTIAFDLKGCSVVPGMYDSHTHLLAQGQTQLMFSADAMSEDEILGNAKRKVLDTAPGEWVEGYCGFRNSKWDTLDPANFVSTESLDAISPKNPLYIHRTAGQGGILRANTRALELAGIPKGTQLYSGYAMLPEIEKALLMAIPHDNKRIAKRALLAAQQEMFSYGVTSCVYVCVSQEEEHILRELYTEGLLKLRIHAALGNLAGDTVQSMKERMYTAPSTGEYDHRFTARSIKLFADGTFGRHTAALLEDYTDQPGCKGKLNYTDSDLYEIISEAGRRGYQPLIHTVGDRAMEQVLRIYKRVIEEQQLSDHRFKIEHLQLICPGDPEQMRSLKLVASMQAAHAPYNRIMTQQRLGNARLKWTYALQHVLQAGVPIAGGSDAPVQSANPFEGIYAAVTRKYIDGQPAEGYIPENAISREAALRSYTIMGAYGNFAEGYLGTLETGKTADLAILDCDFTKCPTEKLKDIRVVCTVCSGEIVYQAD